MSNVSVIHDIVLNCRAKGTAYWLLAYIFNGKLAMVKLCNEKAVSNHPTLRI